MQSWSVKKKITLKIKYFFMKKSDSGNNDTTNNGYIIKI